MARNTHSTRSIRLRNIAVPMDIGIHDFERLGPQRVLINVTLELSESLGENSDKIADALDYDQVHESVLRIAGSRHFNLQESLCREIVDDLKRLPKLTRLVVTSDKPDVYPDCDGVGYRIELIVDPD
jgi:dihydroneopterin aldolase